MVDTEFDETRKTLLSKSMKDTGALLHEPLKSTESAPEIEELNTNTTAIKNAEVRILFI